jgi:hypothetical protein
MPTVSLKEAAKLINVSAGSLRVWRSRGHKAGPPPMTKQGARWVVETNALLMWNRKRLEVDGRAGNMPPNQSAELRRKDELIANLKAENQRLESAAVRLYQQIQKAPDGEQLNRLEEENRKLKAEVDGLQARPNQSAELRDKDELIAGLKAELDAANAKPYLPGFEGIFRVEGEGFIFDAPLLHEYFNKNSHLKFKNGRLQIRGDDETIDIHVVRVNICGRSFCIDLANDYYQ